MGLGAARPRIPRPAGSPATGSSMLISTHAATMPSITLSNYKPLTLFGFGYEALRGADVHERRDLLSRASCRPAARASQGCTSRWSRRRGYALGVTRLLQFGGAGRPGSLGDLHEGVLRPLGLRQRRRKALGVDEQFGNQVASITSQLIFPGRTPFTIYFEYAGEDTSAATNYLLGNACADGGHPLSRDSGSASISYMKPRNGRTSGTSTTSTATGSPTRATSSATGAAMNA